MLNQRQAEPRACHFSFLSAPIHFNRGMKRWTAKHCPSSGSRTELFRSGTVFFHPSDIAVDPTLHEFAGIGAGEIIGGVEESIFNLQKHLRLA